MSITMKIIQKLLALFYFLLCAAGICALLGAAYFFIILKDLPQVPDPLSRIIETPPTEIYSASQERIMLIGGREAVPLTLVSEHFINAVIATEDHRFRTHHGVDKLRTLKALYITLFIKGKVQGASTITQQLSKNLFFSFRQTYIRKIKELLVAIQIEKKYTKDEILEAYINQIPFGVGAHGIEQAAKKFFGKSALELNLAEAALLAGLPKGPARYNPYLHFERAKNRQKVVLSRLLATGYITKEESDAAAREELQLRPKSLASRTGSYFLDAVIRELEDRYGPEAVYHGGLKVTTTLEPQIQAWAEDAVEKGLSDLDKVIGIKEANKETTDNKKDLKKAERPQGALVSIDTNSGAVKAIVGGRNYFETEYNRAIQSSRRPGSGFKPFVYYAAFEKLNLNPATVMIDKPVTIKIKGAKNWSPKNFGKKNSGPMIIKTALTKSVNTIAAQLVEKTDPKAVVSVAKRCGVKSRLKPVYSIALGASEVKPFEMASAFATFANGGVRHKPFIIKSVEDPFGRILEEHLVAGEKVLDPAITYQVVNMMQAVVDAGTARRVRSLGFVLPAAGKTGTTDDYFDAWFTGFTPSLCTTVWVGYDRKKGLRASNRVGITGGRAAVPIWSYFMLKATDGDPPREFTRPSNIEFKNVDPLTGCEVDDPNGKTVQVVLRKGQTVCQKDKQPKTNVNTQ